MSFLIRKKRAYSPLKLNFNAFWTKGSIGKGERQAPIVLFSRGSHRQDNSNPGACAGLALDPDITMVGQHDMPHDTHAQPDALDRGIRGIGTVETLFMLCS